MERDRECGSGKGSIQLLGLEHYRRNPYASHREWQYAHHPRSDAQSATLLTRLQPVRAQLSDIRPHGGPDIALPSRFLFRGRIRRRKILVSLAVHSHHTSMSCLYFQYYSNCCR